MEAVQDQHLSEALVGTSRGMTIVYLGGLWIIYRIGRALYNISPFHPLYHIPGPKLAAMSFAYEFYYDVILGGRFTKHLQKMHEQYGPIVRFNPHELSCNDDQLLDDLYCHGNRIRDKSQHMMYAAPGPLAASGFATVHHEVHRARRNSMSSYFSRGQILKIEPEISTFIPRFCAKLLRQKEPFETVEAFGCLSGDVIAHFAYGEPMGYVDQPGLRPNFTEQAEAFTDAIHLYKFFAPLRWLTACMAAVAPYLARLIPEAEMPQLLREILITSPNRVRKAKAELDAGNGKPDSILPGILASDLPEEEKALDRVTGESFALLVGGTETVAKTFSIITYHLLAQPHKLDTLQRALHDNGVDPDNLSWQKLEKIPELEGVVMEGLRLSYGLVGRAMRSARDEVLVYRSKDGKTQIPIPKNTPVGVSALFLHHNEEAFPDSHEFLPERWVQARGAQRRLMDRHFMAFGKGSRQCLGINLAWCELYLVTASIALRLLPHLRLYKTTQEDVTFEREYGVYLPRKGSKGIRVEVVA